MNYTRFFVLFILFVIVYTIIVEIFTVLFRMTGVTAEKARTQVISLLTNCGFTTSESELALASHRRRKLAQVTMLCGYSFSVIIVSVLVNLFFALNLAEVRNLIFPLAGLVLFIAALLLMMRLRAVREWIDHLIERVSARLMYGKNTNLLILIDTYHKKSMMEAVLEHVPETLRGIPLSQSGLKETYGIQILSIIRRGEPLEQINGETCLNPGDQLVLFGDSKRIHAVFGCPEGPEDENTFG